MIDTVCKQQVIDLLDFIDRCPSPWHAAHDVATELQKHGFELLSETQYWQLEPGGRYYVIRDDSSIIAFIQGQEPIAESGFRIIGAHTDSPGLRVKPNPISHNQSLVQLGVEPYGGLILATFTDRDLTLAGRINYQEGLHFSDIQTRLVKFDKPIVRIPNIAIHLNRSVNEDGLVVDANDDLNMMLGCVAEHLPDEVDFKQLLAQQAGLSTEQILSWELQVTDAQPGDFFGANDEFFANSQLDNLASCHAGLQALICSSHQASAATRMIAFFDHEEVGSVSHKGAAGSFLEDVLYRILEGESGQSVQQAFRNSFVISADMSHAYHPNHPEVYDKAHQALINHGPVIKINSNQRYTTDSYSEAYFIQLCKQVDVPYQKYIHRCNLPCGSTIGPMTAAKLGMRSIDVGNPMWSMHSARECAGTLDHERMIRVMTQFFKG